jgi:uncharacterized protein
MNAQAMTERFELRLSPSVLEELDSWRALQDDLPNRSEAVRRLVEAGLREGDERRIRLGDGEKLIIIMLCQLLDQMKAKGEIDPSFVEDVVYGGHYWALDWKHEGLFHRYEDAPSVVTQVVDILDMWRFIERAFGSLSKKNRARVEAEAKSLHLDFAGFDEKHEGEHVRVARFLIEKLGRFTEFKGRDLNSHIPVLTRYTRMLSVFEPMRKALIGRELSADEIVEILQAGMRPNAEKA